MIALIPELGYDERECPIYTETARIYNLSYGKK